MPLCTLAYHWWTSESVFRTLFMVPLLEFDLTQYMVEFYFGSIFSLHVVLSHVFAYLQELVLGWLEDHHWEKDRC